MKVRSGIPGTHIQVCPYKAWDWLVSGAWVEPPPGDCGGCSKALDSGMMGNAEGNLAR